jgi:hypothetical protein
MKNNVSLFGAPALFVMAALSTSKRVEPAKCQRVNGDRREDIDGIFVLRGGKQRLRLLQSRRDDAEKRPRL